MHVEATSTFLRLYKRLPADVQEQVKKTLRLFQEDTRHPSLGHKKMAGRVDIYELRVSLSYRITYKRDGETAILRKVGTHDLL